MSIFDPHGIYRQAPQVGYKGQIIQKRAVYNNNQFKSFVDNQPQDDPETIIYSNISTAEFSVFCPFSIVGSEYRINIKNVLGNLGVNIRNANPEFFNHFGDPDLFKIHISNDHLIWSNQRFHYNIGDYLFLRIKNGDNFIQTEDLLDSSELDPTPNKIKKGVDYRFQYLYGNQSAMVFMADGVNYCTSSFARPSLTNSVSLIEYDAQTEISDYSWILANPSDQWFRSDNLYIINCPNNGEYDVYPYNTFRINVIAAWRN